MIRFSFSYSSKVDPTCLTIFDFAKIKYRVRNLKNHSYFNEICCTNAICWYMCGTSSMCFTPNMMAKYPMNVTFDQKHFKNACSHTHTLNSTVIQSVDIWCNTLCDALRMRMAKQKKNYKHIVWLVHLRPNDKLDLSRRNRICVQEGKNQPHFFVVAAVVIKEWRNVEHVSVDAFPTLNQNQPSDDSQQFSYERRKERDSCDSRVKWNEKNTTKSSSIDFCLIWDTRTHMHALMHKDMSKAKKNGINCTSTKRKWKSKKFLFWTKTAFYSFLIGYAT